MHATILVLALGWPAQSPPQAEPGPKMLYDFLQGEAKKHFDARRKTVAELKSPDEVRARQAMLRKKFIEALGGFPEKTPLKPRVVGKLSGEGFRVEKVVYESRPGHQVTANLYIPEGKGPFPGVLVPCGHSANGKAAEAYQRVCILMARNGLAVLCYDPIGQGERLQLLTPAGKAAIPGSTSEHTMTGIGALLVGWSTATYRIWDGIRSLDYLASRPEVDPKRLGCTGNSGGGTLTSYLMALDDRIVAAAPSCYLTSLERLFATIGPQDAEQNITGQVAFGMEHADYVTLRAPRPTLILTGTQDYFDIQGSWISFREAKLIYGLLGHGERVDLFEFNDKHGFSKPRREAALRWMRRWLLNKDDAPIEGNFPVFKDADLQCTRTGQVLEDYKGKSVFHLNAERENELAKVRAAFLKTSKPDDVARQVRRLLALGETIPAAKMVNRKPTSGWFETEPGIAVPFSRSLGGAGKPVVIYLHERGIGGAKEAIDALTGQGKVVVALDLRGLGSTAPRQNPPNRPATFGVDFKEAFLSLHLNRPLLGQRVLDVLAVVEALARQKDIGPITLVGVGSCGPVALHAAALEPRIKEVTIEGAITSWSRVVKTPISINQLGNVVPGVLAWYDLPDLAGLLAARKLTIRAAVDPAGKPLTRDEAEREYARCKQAFAQGGGQLRFE